MEEAMLIVFVLLSIWLACALMPTSWRRWALRSRQDDQHAVNEQTMAALEAILKTLDTMTQRLDLLQWEVDRLYNKKTVAAPPALPPSALATSTTEDARNG